MLYDVAVIGDCVQDMFILAKSKLITEKNKKTKYLSYIYGDKINVDELHYDLGGSACNAAVGMRLARIRTTMVSVLGDCIYSKNVIEQLRKKKVGRSFLVKEKNKCLGSSFILLGSDRDRTILTYRPENDFEKINLGKVLWLSNSFYIAGINKYSKVLIKDLLNNSKIKSKKIYINPSGYQIEQDLVNLKKLFKISKIVAVNVEEAMKILKTKKKTAVKELLKNIKNLGPEIVLITDGKKGAYAYDGNKYFKSGLYPSKRIDSTGAGDSFCATFVAAQVRGYNIEDSLSFASINSASVVSVYGAQRGLLGWKILKERFEKKKVKINKI